MNRSIWGAALIAVGIMGFLQVVGEVNFGLAFWPVVLAFIALSLLMSGLRRRGWFSLALGTWMLGIAVFEMLHNAGVTAASGSTVARFGWPLLFVGIGIAIIMRHGEPIWGRTITGPKRTAFVGDLRYGSDPWVLDKDLVLEHQVGDMRLDLTTADISDGVHHIRVRARVGEVAVIVPDNVNVEASTRVSVGDLEVLGDQRSGVGLELYKQRRREGSEIELRIDARLGVGRLTVREAPPHTLG